LLALTISPFDPDPSRWQEDCPALYRRYREADPVHWGHSPNPSLPGCWYLFRHAEVEAALSDPRYGRERPGEGVSKPGAVAASRLSPGLVELDAGWMIHRDPPAHTASRRWLGQSLSVGLVDAFQSRLCSLTEDLISELPTVGPVDFMAQFAERLPARAMSELLGFDGPAAVGFAESVVSLLSSRRPAEDYSRGRASLAGQLSALIKARRRAPRADLVSRMLAVRREQQGDDNLGLAELVSTCLFLLTTGYRVTVDLLGNGLLCLLSRPDEYGAVLAEPEMLPRAVQECLRFESPVQMVDRWVHEDMELCGKTLRTGQRVYLVLGAANRDPACFEEPDKLDFRRSEQHHLAVGAGTHFCLGARLARIQAEIAFRLLPRRLPGLKLNGTLPRWQLDASFRSLQLLSVCYLQHAKGAGHA
jgi:cytochrome P450 StaP